MILRLLLLFFLFQFTVTYQAIAQPSQTDSSSNQTALLKALQVYQSAMDGYKALYNGIEYTRSYPGTTGHPYFESDTLQQGSILYDGIFYPQIGLKYNLVSQEVILIGKQNLAISLITEKIQSFTIKDHHFIKFKADSSVDKATSDGYFEVLYNGPTTVLASRRKNIERGSRVEDPMLFKQYSRYFLKKNGSYYPIESEKALLALCEDQKEALKTYLRKTKLNFKKDIEYSLVKAVSYYDQLKN